MVQEKMFSIDSKKKRQEKRNLELPTIGWEIVHWFALMEPNVFGWACQ